MFPKCEQVVRVSVILWATQKAAKLPLWVWQTKKRNVGTCSSQEKVPITSTKAVKQFPETQSRQEGVSGKNKTVRMTSTCLIFVSRSWWAMAMPWCLHFRFQFREPPAKATKDSKRWPPKILLGYYVHKVLAVEGLMDAGLWNSQRKRNSRPSQSYGPRGTWETTTAKHQHSKHHCTKVFSWELHVS